jgi:hypothetical protein
MKTYQRLATLIQAQANCHARNNAEWFDRHSDAITEIMTNTAPSGAGFDCGTKISDESTPEKLLFETSYHHMDEQGGYDGWSHHRITVKSSLAFGFSLSISGRDRNHIKDYIHDVFSTWLAEEETTEA